MALLVLTFLLDSAGHLWVGHGDDAPVAAGEDRRPADGIDPPIREEQRRRQPRERAIAQGDEDEQVWLAG